MKPPLIRQGEAGQILIEALVAVLIVGSVTGVLFETMASKASLSRQVTQHRAALLVAQSELAAALADAPLGDEGDVGYFHWTLGVAPYGDGARAGPLALEQVEIAVSVATAPSRPLVVLRALRSAR